MEVPALGKSAAAERVEESKPQEVLEAETAFLVIKSNDGRYMISLDINMPINVEKESTLSEVKGALHSVLDDLNNQETAALAAQNVVMHQMQMARRITEAQQNQQIIEGLPQGLAN